MLYGGNAANDDLKLEGTSHPTRTSSYVLINPDGGLTGIRTATPLYALDINATTTITALHASSDGTDTGFYLTPAGTAAYFGTAAYSGAAWIAKATYSVLMGEDSAGFHFYHNTGLTPGNSFTPTNRVIVNTTGLGVQMTPAYTLDVTGNCRLSTGFGCNGTLPQTAYPSGVLWQLTRQEHLDLIQLRTWVPFMPSWSQ